MAMSSEHMMFAPWFRLQSISSNVPMNEMLVSLNSPRPHRIPIISQSFNLFRDHPNESPVLAMLVRGRNWSNSFAKCLVSPKMVQLDSHTILVPFDS
jgi:hypothetical protein